MTAKHTQAPWHIGMKPGPMSYGQKGEQVADARPHWLPDDEHKANVRLIAAAPDMLEALEGLFREFRYQRFDVRKDFSKLLYIEAARKAIAKAKGE